MSKTKQEKLNTILGKIQTKVYNTKTKDKLAVSNGNIKIGRSTLIINMGTAEECPSAALGMCNATKNGAHCYALKAERLYPSAAPYRQRQFSYWRNNTATKIANDLIAKIGNRTSTIAIRYVRFNESGDFWDQTDVKKLNTIAKKLKNFNIVTYGYTARRDLDYTNVNFLVKGSGHKKGNNGMTTIISKSDDIPEGFRECPGSCKTCNLCMVDKKFNIAFRKH